MLFFPFAQPKDSKSFAKNIVLPERTSGPVSSYQVCARVQGQAFKEKQQEQIAAEETQQRRGCVAVAVVHLRAASSHL